MNTLTFSDYVINEKAKIHRRKLKKIFCRITGQISTRLGEGFTNKKLSILKRVNMFFPLLSVESLLFVNVLWVDLFLRWMMWPMGLLLLYSFIGIVKQNILFKGFMFQFMSIWEYMSYSNYVEQRRNTEFSLFLSIEKLSLPNFNYQIPYMADNSFLEITIISSNKTTLRSLENNENHLVQWIWLVTLPLWYKFL